MAIAFSVSKKDGVLIQRAVDRLRVIWERTIKDEPFPAMEFHMDLTACHANGCPLNLAQLLAFDDGDFSHDMGGIREHLNRQTGEMGNCFLPRCAESD